MMRCFYFFRTAKPVKAEPNYLFIYINTEFALTKINLYSPLLAYSYSFWLISISCNILLLLLYSHSNALHCGVFISDLTASSISY